MLDDISAGAKDGTGANILDTEVKLNHRYVATLWGPDSSYSESQCS